MINDRESARRLATDRDLEDAAAVLTVLAALAAGAPAPASPPAALWGDPAHRLGAGSPGSRAWWASGLPR
jgi:hypothetical protein